MSRVSNKQVLDAIQAMPEAIAAAISGYQVKNVQTADEAATTPTPAGTAKVDAAYLGHVTAKLQSRANADGNTYVLYARTNKRDETKLAYCQADKFAGLTDRRIIGAVQTVSPE